MHDSLSRVIFDCPKMAKIVKILSSIGVLASIAWVYTKPGYDSALSLITTLVALAGSFVVEKRGAKLPHQNQTVSGSSIGIQAGGDVHTGKITTKSTSK